MKKVIFIGVASFLALTAIAVYFIVIKSTQDNNISVVESQKSNTEEKKISKEELAKHNSRNDCWVAYKGRAYDVTAWLPKHPGGVDKIAQFCGSENFETGFNKQHGTSKEGKLYQEATLVGILEM